MIISRPRLVRGRLFYFLAFPCNCRSRPYSTERYTPPKPFRWGQVRVELSFRHALVVVTTVLVAVAFAVFAVLTAAIFVAAVLFFLVLLILFVLIILHIFLLLFKNLLRAE